MKRTREEREPLSRSVRPRLSSPVTRTALSSLPLALMPPLPMNQMSTQTPLQRIPRRSQIDPYLLSQLLSQASVTVDINTLLNSKSITDIGKQVAIPTASGIVYLPIETTATARQFFCLFQLYRNSKYTFHVHISQPLYPDYSILPAPCSTGSFTLDQFKNTPLTSTSKWIIYLEHIYRIETSILPLLFHDDFLHNPNTNIQIVFNDAWFGNLPPLFLLQAYGLQYWDKIIVNDMQVPPVVYNDTPTDYTPILPLVLPRVQGNLNIKSDIGPEYLPLLNSATQVSSLQFDVTQNSAPLLYQYIMGNTYAQLPLTSLSIDALISSPVPDVTNCNQWIQGNLTPSNDYTYCGALGILLLALQRNPNIKNLSLDYMDLSNIQNVQALIPLLSNIQSLTIADSRLNGATRNALLLLPNLTRYFELNLSGFPLDPNLINALKMNNKLDNVNLGQINLTYDENTRNVLDEFYRLRALRAAEKTYNFRFRIAVPQHVNESEIDYAIRTQHLANELQRTLRINAFPDEHNNERFIIID
jgi:hypothetical protein